MKFPDFNARPTLVVHKFSSCDGCQLAFLNAGPDLLTLAELVDIRFFAEAGIGPEPDEEMDIAIIEGSISTHEEESRIAKIRESCKFLITIGACACSGGVQGLRNLYDSGNWLEDIYATPEHIDSLRCAAPVSDYINVDLELWGCPVNAGQVLGAVRSLLFGAMPLQDHDKLCMECKRQQTVCTMVTRGVPCMGPVTQTGCGALCPSFGRDCYGCFGPSESPNSEALGQRLEGLGLNAHAITRRFHLLNSGADDCLSAGEIWKGKCDESDQ